VHGGLIDMRTLDVIIHVRSPGANPGPVVATEESDRGVRTLNVPVDGWAAPLAISFEDCVAAMQSLPRMFVEPDGSFVWTGHHDGGDWQLDGSVADRRGHVVWIEVRGRCPSARFDQILRVLGWPEVPLMFQLRRAGVVVEESELRRLLWPDEPRRPPDCIGGRE
jgi:hypothetical protein